MITFYTVCFGVGVLMSVLSLVSRFHLPHSGHGLFGRFGSRLQLPHPKHGPGAGLSHVSPYNFAALMSFLASFGGSGILLQATSLMTALAVVLATVAGIAAAAFVNSFLRYLVRLEQPMEHSSIVGIVARVIVPIRAGGTGEILFSSAGTRRCAGARALDAAAVERDREVVIVRYERGIAYVRPFDEMISPP